MKTLIKEAEKEFDEKFVDKPESYTTHEEPYKIGERNYTGEHYIMPAYTLKLNIGQAEIKRFIHSTLNKEREQERNRLIEKVEQRINTKQHICSFNDGESACACYNQAISDILTILKEDGKN